MWPGVATSHREAAPRKPPPRAEYRKEAIPSRPAATTVGDNPSTAHLLSIKAALHITVRANSIIQSKAVATHRTHTSMSAPSTASHCATLMSTLIQCRRSKRRLASDSPANAASRARLMSGISACRAKINPASASHINTISQDPPEPMIKVISAISVVMAMVR